MTGGSALVGGSLPVSPPVLAGYGDMAAVEEGEDADIRALFETNVFGPAAVTRAVLPGMRARRHGTIVNIASVGGIIGFPGSGYYAEGLSGERGRASRTPRPADRTRPVPDGLGRAVAEAIVDLHHRLRADGGKALRRRAQGRQAGCRYTELHHSPPAVIKALQSPEPPQHLVLGREGFENAERQLKSELEQIELWKETSFSADYPISSARAAS